jgi:hypothetical protein
MQFTEVAGEEDAWWSEGVRGQDYGHKLVFE